MYNESELNQIGEVITMLDTKRLAEVFRLISFVPGEEYALHSHRRIEINYVKRGECRMNIGKQCILFKEGETACIFSHMEHSFQAGAKGCTLMQLEFLPDIFIHYEKLLLGSIQDEQYKLGRKYLKIVQDPEIVSTIQNILEELSSGHKYNRMMIQLYYGILLICITRHINELLVLDCHNKRLRAAVTFIQENFAGDISVGDLAGRINISERYLRQLFERHLGLSPNEYICKVRIDKAVQLLSSLSYQYSIKEICYMCGFKTPQYFTKVFRQIIGVTPSEYMRR